MTQLALVCMKMEDDCLYVVCMSRVFPHFLALSKFQEFLKISFIVSVRCFIIQLNRLPCHSAGWGQGMLVSFSFWLF